ncbi:MAG: Mpo1-like protein [Betaproteobacteria bacterium]
MKTLAQQMAVYNAYHLHATNRATHFVGVPLIIFALLIPMSWPAVQIGGASITGAMLFVAIVGVYYLILDVPMGLLTNGAVVLLLWAAHLAAGLGYGIGSALFVAAFVAGWIFQLVGHAIEGRRPALVDNFFQIFVAPVFLVAEALFALGARRALRQEVDALTVR